MINNILNIEINEKKQLKLPSQVNISIKSIIINKIIQLWWDKNKMHILLARNHISNCGEATGSCVVPVILQGYKSLN